MTSDVGLGADELGQEPEHARLLVIGGGPAGYTAALYSARAGLEPTCIEGFEAGGQIAKSGRVENFPGALGLTGADLSWRIREQAEEFGARLVVDDVVDVDFSRRPFVVVTAGGLYTADAVIVATGSKPRSLGVPREEELVGRGVAYCAVCDGAFYEGQEVAVVGGGNAALTEALAMARIASKVTLVHRRWQFRAEAVIEDAVRADERVEIVRPAVVDQLLTDENDNLDGVRLRHLVTGEHTDLAVHGLFVAVGHEPASGLFAPWLDTRSGHIVTQAESTATSLPGVFAAGDVADARYRQAITAAATGCMAALDAERRRRTTTPSTTRPSPSGRSRADRPARAGPRRPGPRRPRSLTRRPPARPDRSRSPRCPTSSSTRRPAARCAPATGRSSTTRACRTSRRTPARTRACCRTSRPRASGWCRPCSSARSTSPGSARRACSSC